MKKTTVDQIATKIPVVDLVPLCRRTQNLTDITLQIPSPVLVSRMRLWRNSWAHKALLGPCPSNEPLTDDKNYVRSGAK